MPRDGRHTSINSIIILKLHVPNYYSFIKWMYIWTGMTPLHQAIMDGNFAAVRLLVLHGADVNRKDDDTWTPLHAACSEGHADIVR